MIVEERSYTLQPGTTAEYLSRYERHGLPVQRPILGNLVGYFSSEIGILNQVVHLWAYEDLGDRARRRAELQANPDWQAYIVTVRPFIVRQENRILIPAPFSPWASRPEG